MHRSQSLGNLVSDTLKGGGGEDPRAYPEKRVVGGHVSKAIPMYTGYCQGKKNLDCEANVQSGLFSAVANQSKDIKARTMFGRLSADEKAPYVNKTWFDRMPAEEPEALKESYRGAPKAFAADLVAAGDYRESKIPRSLPKVPFHEDCGPQGHGATLCGITNYTGYLPGYKSENSFGSTWQRTRMRSVGAKLDHHDKIRHISTVDARHPAKACVRITKEGTAVQEVETDQLPEMVPFNNSYLDVKRGYSSCMFSGTHIDPAGRMPPSGAGKISRQPPRQDTFGRQRPLVAGLPPGYTGYTGGKLSENVIGERGCKTHEICRFLTYKNQIRNVQR